MGETPNHMCELERRYHRIDHRRADDLDRVLAEVVREQGRENRAARYDDLGPPEDEK